MVFASPIRCEWQADRGLEAGTVGSRRCANVWALSPIGPEFVRSQKMNAGCWTGRVQMFALTAPANVSEGIDVFGLVDFDFDSKAASIAFGKL